MLPSGDDVAGLQPQFNEIQKCPSRGVIVTGPAPPGSGFDFYSRFFCPKLGIPEVVEITITRNMPLNRNLT